MSARFSRAGSFSSESVSARRFPRRAFFPVAGRKKARLAAGFLEPGGTAVQSA